MKDHDPSRRKFAKKLAYVAPAILTLKATPSFAAAGSGGNRRSDRGRSNDNRWSGSDRNRDRGKDRDRSGDGYGRR